MITTSAVRAVIAMAAMLTSVVLRRNMLTARSRAPGGLDWHQAHGILPVDRRLSRRDRVRRGPRVRPHAAPVSLGAPAGDRPPLPGSGARARRRGVADRVRAAGAAGMASRGMTLAARAWI